MRRLIVASILSAIAGAALATGVMLWQPWGDDFNAARCDAATRAWQAASGEDFLLTDALKEVRAKAFNSWLNKCDIQR